jgi:hypothetical protein
MRWARVIWVVTASMLATSALAAAPPAAPAGEPPLFTLFRSVCIAHQGDIKAAEAEARQQGFVTVPPPADVDPASMAGRTVLKRDSADLPAVVILTRAADDTLAGAPNAEATLCGVSGPDPGGAVAMAAKAWLGLESNSQDGNHTTFLYRQSPVQRLLLADQEDVTIRAAIAAGEFREFDVDPEAEGINLGLMTGAPRKP